MTSRLERSAGWVAIAVVLTAQLVPAQVAIPPGFNRPMQAPPPTAAPQQQPQPQPQTPAPAAAPAAPAQQPAAPPPPAATSGGLNLQNASLREVIDILARALKISYILDPRVNGAVTINTYGETKSIDNRALLDTILRLNNAAMVQAGDVYRIVPLVDVQKQPGLKPEQQTNPSAIPNDDRTMLNLVFLKFAIADEIAKLLDVFLGEGGKMWSYPPANLLLIQDSARNMRRLMELLALFDSNTFANQRVKLFDVKNSRPSDLAKELEGILKGVSLNEKSTPVKLLPVDRINTLIAVAPNPGVFSEVETWIKKLDIVVTSSAGSVENFVYRVKYGNAPTLAMAIMGLYSDNPMYAMNLMMSFGMGGMGMGGGMYGGGMGGGMYGGGMGGGMYGGGMYGGAGMYGGMGGMYGGMGGMYGGMGGMYGGMYPGMYPGMNAPMASIPSSQAAQGIAAQQRDQTGQYLTQTPGGQGTQSRQPRVIPNPFDNTLLIQATRQEYEGMLKLLRDIDVPPRQVLIEARIYEVSLTGALASGVAAYLQNRTGSGAGSDDVKGTFTRQLTGSFSGGGTVLSAGALVGQSRQLLAAFSASEVARNSRLISAPSVIATDSIPASINVGTQVPTLTSQAITGAQQNGNSLFANQISNRDTGVTLNIMARVNPSGIVTMTINQEVSAPIPPDPEGGIQSPSFSKRTVQTQVTIQDGDTIAIAGIINESRTSASGGIPVLHRLPIMGAAFGSRSYNKERTELVIFMVPRVIYDMNSLNDASDELKNRMRRISRYMQE